MIKWILVILGFVALFTLMICYVIGLKKVLKEDQEDFYNANYSDDKEQENNIEK